MWSIKWWNYKRSRNKNIWLIYKRIFGDLCQVSFYVCPAWATTWRWKSVVGLVVGTTSQWQGCLLWGRIWRKSEAKSRSEGYELHTRLTKVGRVCITKQSPTLPKTLGVNVADIWDEGCCSYLGRSDRYIANKDKFLKR